MIRDSGVQPDFALRHLYGQKKRAARSAVERARGDVEDSIYSQLEEDGRRKLIFKRDRKEEGVDVKGGRLVRDQDGKLTTNKEEVIKVWENYFKELYNEGGGVNLDLPSSVRG